MGNRWGNNGNSDRLFLGGGSQITADGDCSHEIKTLTPWKESYDQLSILKIRDITLPTKACIVKAMVFYSSHVCMWELDCKESWVQKNWCFWTMVLEKTLESPLDCKEIQPVHPKGNQSGVFIGRTDAEAETPILWPPDVKSWLTGKDSDAGKDWGQKEKGTTEDEMFGWHHRLNGHGFGWTPGVGDAQGGLAFMGSQRVRHDWATELNWSSAKSTSIFRAGLLRALSMLIFTVNPQEEQSVPQWLPNRVFSQWPQRPLFLRVLKG